MTLEDVVEELVGEIVDETDREEPLVRPLAGGKLLVHGRMPVDQLESLLELEFVDGDWDTVGGLIFSVLGHVPEVGETVDSNGVQLRSSAWKVDASPRSASTRLGPRRGRERDLGAAR